MDNAKDLMVGILGASGAFSALLLVYSGFIFAQAASFPAANTRDSLLRKYTKAGRLALLPFGAFLIVGILSTLWLIYPQHCLFVVCVAIFLAAIVGTGVYGALASFKYL